jgi:hypothetical protein
MSVTINIDEAMWRAAEQATDIHDPTELVRLLIERELRLRSAQHRLAAAGGTMPDLNVPPRQRPGSENR